MRDWVPGQDVHCERLRENGKLIEFCVRSNKAGLFVAIAVYYGGAQRGCIMILASFNHAGWSLIHNSQGFLKIWEPFWKRKILYKKKKKKTR